MADKASNKRTAPALPLGPVSEYPDLKSLVSARVSHKDFRRNDPALGQAVFDWLHEHVAVFVYRLDTRQPTMLLEGKEHLLSMED